MSDIQSGYVNVGPLDMYYELRGQGRPLLLLHAGFSSIDSSFEQLIPSFADRQIVGVEQQAHGHTPDIDRPLSYEQMVEDTAAVLQKLEQTSVDVFGWSDGGVVALGLAARHPQLVRRVAIIGAGYTADAETPEFKKKLASMPADNPNLTPFREAYEKVAPDKNGWAVLIEKVKSMAARFEGYADDEMRGLKAPLMVMLGDRDFTRLEHAVGLYRMVPKGWLAVLPGSDHSAPVARADWVAAMLREFYEGKEGGDG